MQLSSCNIYNELSSFFLIFRYGQKFFQRFQLISYISSSIMCLRQLWINRKWQTFFFYLPRRQRKEKKICSHNAHWDWSFSSGDFCLLLIFFPKTRSNEENLETFLEHDLDQLKRFFSKTNKNVEFQIKIKNSSSSLLRQKKKWQKIVSILIDIFFFAKKPSLSVCC